jgi:ferredoxin
MRVIIDPGLCEGNGVCEQVSPEVFRVGDDDRARALIEHPAEHFRAVVESAVRRCPRRAIRTLED